MLLKWTIPFRLHANLILMKRRSGSGTIWLARCRATEERRCAFGTFETCRRNQATSEPGSDAEYARTEFFFSVVKGFG
jgi:hypothetical protein